VPPGTVTARRRQVRVDIEEEGAWKVSFEVVATPLVLVHQVPAHVHDPKAGIVQSLG
jgi:hypothetical protein